MITELRKGSKVELATDNQQPIIKEIHEKSVIVDMRGLDFDGLDLAIGNHKLLPIKLSENLLKKINFSFTMDTPYWARFTIGDMDITIRLTDGEVRIDESVIPAKCLYLHQLQNLYLALSGKEVEFN